MRQLNTLCVLLAFLGLYGCGAETHEEDTTHPYNFVIILTDDQRWDTLWAMPEVQGRLVDSGVNFTNAISTTPVCCPARASLLTGFYAHNTGVLDNSSTNGQRTNFQETDTVATSLQSAGYRTGFIGKYMHGYTPGYVPPGWTYFVANNNGGMLQDWFHLADVTTGSSKSKPERGKITPSTNQYLTYFHKDRALEFLTRYGHSSFFLMVSTYAPHTPACPAPGDEKVFSNYVYRERSYGEKDLSDKPRWVQKAAKDFPICPDDLPRKQLRSLPALDRLVKSIFDKVNNLGVLNRTIFFYTSDNGVTWGDHNLACDKGMPYEESIRVPLSILMPGIKAHKDNHMVAANLDLAATIYDLVGIQKRTDGRSLVPLLRGTPTVWREEIQIEAFGYSSWKFDTPGIWSGLRTEKWKYVEHIDGDQELYDLIQDPDELDNKRSDPAFRDLIDQFSSRLEKGVAISIFDAPEGQIHQDYKLQLKAWGGRSPYLWRVKRGRLPEGLTLNQQTGLIHGRPQRLERQEFVIEVISRAIAAHTGKPRVFSWKYVINIEPKPSTKTIHP